MNSLIVGRDADVAKWVGAQLGVCDWGPCSALGVGRDGTCIAGAVYNQFTGTSVQISLVSQSPLWCTRPVLAAIFGFPFNQLGVARLWLHVEADNARCLKLIDGLGFVREGITRNGFGLDRNGVIASMIPNDAARWLR